jgi:RCC1 and BTB domain-containing protein
MHILHIKNDIKEIEIDLYSYNVYYAFLKYIYTDSVDIEVEDSIELFDLANSYFEEDLKRKCTQMIENCISTSNAFALYSSAVKKEAQDSEEICSRFATNKLLMPSKILIQFCANDSSKVRQN